MYGMCQNILIGKQAFIDASRDSNIDVIRTLLVSGVHPDTSIHGGTLLHMATRVELVKLLLAHGASINARNHLRKTPLSEAISLGRDAIANALIEAGADVNLADMYGMTPLHLAIYNGNTAMVKMLLRSGADIHAISRDRRTVLKTVFVRVNSSTLGILKAVLEAGAGYQIASLNRSDKQFALRILRELGM